MPASTTDKMREALRLVTIKGLSPQLAATKAGVKRQSIYKTAAYKTWRAVQKKETS